MATREEKEHRYYELIEQGLSSTEALAQVDREMEEGYSRGRVVGASSAYREPKESERKKREKVLWKGEKVVGEEDEDVDDEEEIPEKRDEYLKTREGIVRGIRKTKEIVRGAAGLGSRRPIKEALISGAAKAFLALKGKPKTPEEIREAKEEAKRLKRYHEKELHIKRMSEAESAGRYYREPERISFRDIGKGSMGTKKYDIRDPVGYIGNISSSDFFGGSVADTRVHIKKKGRLYGSKPPSTAIYMPSSPPSTSIGMGRLINPLGEIRPTKIGKNKKFMKLKKTQKKDASEVLGLKGFW